MISPTLHGLPRPSVQVLCDGVEWVVAEGEHNAWEALVLFLLQACIP